MVTRSLLPLKSLQLDSLLPPTAVLKGRLDLVVPYSASTSSASLSIEQDGLKVQLHLRGAWAESAARQFGARVGRGALQVFAREGEHARVELAETARGRDGEEFPQRQRLRVVFERGIRGRWKDQTTGTKGETFEFTPDAPPATKKLPQPRKRSLSPESDTLDILPPSRQTSASSSASTLSDRTNLPSADGAVSPAHQYTPLAVPIANPDNPFVGLGAPARLEDDGSPSCRSPLDPSCERDEGEPVVKKVKKQREERTIWGLSTGKYEYVPLETLKERRNSPGINLVAMAIISKPLAKMTSGTKDCGCMLHLYDPTNASSGFIVEVRYYGLHEEDIPVVKDGDIVLIQGLNWNKDRRQLTAYRGKGVYYVLPPAQLLDGSPIGAFEAPPSRVATLTDAELGYARDLARWAKKHALLENVLGSYAAASGVQEAEVAGAKTRSVLLGKGKGNGGRQLVPIADVCDSVFCDLQGEIVKYYKPYGGNIGSHDACSLFITDYTTNDQLYDYADTSEVSTPGQVTLQVSIFGAQNDPLLHAKSEKNLIGRLVHLRNVRPKMTMNDFLEATMVEDFMYPDRRDVTLLRDSVLKEWHTAFKARRDAYWAKVNGGSSGLAPIFAGNEEKAAPKLAEDPLASVSDTAGLPQQSISSALARSRAGTYRFRVRVIDFDPPRLEDWVAASCPECGNVLTSSMALCLDHQKVEYRWTFMLALADEVDEERLKGGEIKHVIVPVVGGAGVALFPDFSPALFPLLRLGESSAVTALSQRLRGLLGTLPQAKRHKRELTTADAGLPCDVVLNAEKGEGAEMRWTFAEGKVAFR
ncbi:hypothetical protein JCM3770_002778 [Rhodotorula araucariae]